MGKTQHAKDEFAYLKLRGCLQIIFQNYSNEIGRKFMRNLMKLYSGVKTLNLILCLSIFSLGMGGILDLQDIHRENGKKPQFL
jgi:hypothetical protein